MIRGMTTLKTRRFGVLAATVLILLPGCRDEEPKPPRVVINGHVITVEVASTPQQHTVGLSGRQSLAEEHGIFTVARTGVDAGDCVRVTPALYNLPNDLNKLVMALRAMAS